ncbi:MAG: RibD family protein [Chloroflexota bacterium]
MTDPKNATTRSRPSITVKIAQTLDGRIATRTGSSRWISSEASRTFAHALRAEHDAVLVGIGTVLEDDPLLTVRLVSGPDPLRVVADSRLRIPLDSEMLTQSPERTIVVTTPGASAECVARVRDTGARVLIVPAEAAGRVDLDRLLEQLAAEGIHSLMVEGGATLVTELLIRGLVDRLVVVVAPKLIGAGIDAVGDLGILNVADALTFEDVQIRTLDHDVVFDGTLRARNGSHA